MPWRPGLLAAALFALPAQATPTLDAPLSDHAVLQRDKPIVVAGNATPGEVVDVSLGDRKATATAGTDGRWLARLDPLAAGGPHRLVARSTKGEAVAQDILIGDVWLCSGQSNMEFAVNRALNAGSAIISAADPELRLLNIPKGTSIRPASAFTKPVAWEAASPKSVPGFSATCYFMVKSLRNDLKIPIGAINASWGGTQVRAWLDPAGSRTIYGAPDSELLDLYTRDRLAANDRFGKTWSDWWRQSSGDKAGAEPWNAPARLDWKPVTKISSWDAWEGAGLVNHIGWVWVRHTVTLTRAQAARGVTLNLGILDDMNETFVNGRPVGNDFSWDTERSYKLPPEYLREGANEIVMAIGNTYGAGGFSSSADRLFLTLGDGTSLPLGTGWTYAVSPVKTFPPRAPWDQIAGLGLIYNGMIAPLGSYGLRGVAWYQGESDVDVPGYRDRLAALFKGWRGQFGDPALPFLVVSLANYGPFATAPVESGWAQVREDQRRAVLADTHAALAIAFDIGERTDIHPANKGMLGARLAQAAQATAYGAAVAPSGPQPLAARREPGRVVIPFKDVKGALHSWSGAQAIGFELCAATQDSCRYADARAEGSSVILTDDGKPATRIRYAWADSPVVNLYDEAPLPAGPFEIPLVY